MANNYAVIIQDNLRALFARDVNERAAALAAQRENHTLVFDAFGALCRVSPDGITLDDQAEEGPRGIIISLYGLHATPEALCLEPFKSFKEMPDSAPYAAAFTNRTEQALVPAVHLLQKTRTAWSHRLGVTEAPKTVNGDLSFTVRPLPKIALCYVCYLADEDFPAAVTCLYSNNAHRFLPTDALADVGEYTSKTLVGLLNC
ncbi:MAG: hypothetical protein VR64_03680 [Desulfatitalea sp. BRH_c12]|nr:MAG: hypothetical protein VR64_03680 [Desulfatitalea sp. BRH_c12]